MTGGVKGRRDGENIISRLYLHQIGRPDTRRRCDEHARAPVDGAATNNPDVVARIVRQIGVLERKCGLKCVIRCTQRSGQNLSGGVEGGLKSLNTTISCLVAGHVP